MVCSHSQLYRYPVFPRVFLTGLVSYSKAQNISVAILLLFYLLKISGTVGRSDATLSINSG